MEIRSEKGHTPSKKIQYRTRCACLYNFFLYLHAEGWSFPLFASCVCALKHSSYFVQLLAVSKPCSTKKNKFYSEKYKNCNIKYMFPHDIKI